MTSPATFASQPINPTMPSLDIQTLLSSSQVASTAQANVLPQYPGLQLGEILNTPFLYLQLNASCAVETAPTNILPLQSNATLSERGNPNQPQLPLSSSAPRIVKPTTVTNPIASVIPPARGATGFKISNPQSRIGAPMPTNLPLASLPPKFARALVPSAQHAGEVKSKIVARVESVKSARKKGSNPYIGHPKYIDFEILCVLCNKRRGYNCWDTAECRQCLDYLQLEEPGLRDRLMKLTMERRKPVIHDLILAEKARLKAEEQQRRRAVPAPPHVATAAPSPLPPIRAPLGQRAAQPNPAYAPDVRQGGVQRQVATQVHIVEAAPSDMAYPQEQFLGVNCDVQAPIIADRDSSTHSSPDFSFSPSPARSNQSLSSATSSETTPEGSPSSARSPMSVDRWDDFNFGFEVAPGSELASMLEEAGIQI